MPKVAIAERFLETVTTSNRAASIVGDLLEEASNKSRLWFWFGVLRIFASHLLQDLRTHWPRMIWLGITGFLELFIVAILLAYLGHYLGFGNILVNVLVNVLGYGFPILLGWHVAKRSHGHELASGVALVSVFYICARGGMTLRQSMQAMLSITPGCMLLILGTFLFRYRVNTRCRKQQLEKS